MNAGSCTSFVAMLAVLALVAFAATLDGSHAPAMARPVAGDAALPSPVVAGAAAPGSLLDAFDEFTRQHARWLGDEYERGDAQQYDGVQCEHVTQVRQWCRVWHDDPGRSVRYEVRRVDEQHRARCK